MEDSTIVSCPTCGKKYTIGTDKLGRTFKCVGCQTQFQAGAAPEPVETGEIPFVSPSTPQPPPFNPAQAPPQVMSYNSGGMGGGQKTSGMAVAALVCGIIGIPTGCLVIPPLLAIIFGIIGITQTKPGQAKGRGMAITGLVLGGFALLFVPLLLSILLPSLNKARETANRAKCASNLHQIGLAMILYQNDNQQQYPPNLTVLMTSEQLSPSVFVCPSSNDTPTPTPAQLETGGHCSYKYIYPGPNAGFLGATTALAYDNATDHGKDGMNILFGDGHVEWFNTAAAQQYIKP